MLPVLCIGCLFLFATGIFYRKVVKNNMYPSKEVLMCVWLYVCVCAKWQIELPSAKDQT
jgi:hypothetical protein